MIHTSILVRVTIVVMKHHDQTQAEEERIYLTYTFTSQSIAEGSQDRNSNRREAWRQELIQRPWRGAEY